MDIVKSAELLAKSKHSGDVKKDGTTISKHLDDVNNRLKSLGIIDQELLCAGWLHDAIESTEVTFDDIYEQFGSEIAVLVSSLSKDMTLTRKKREKAYSILLKESSAKAKIIKLCDISANLSDIKNWDTTKSKKQRTIKKQRHYLNLIKDELLNTEYPQIISLIDTSNQILKQFGHRPVSLK